MVAWKPLLESVLVLAAFRSIQSSHAAHLRSLGLLQDLLEGAIDELTDDTTAPTDAPTTAFPSALPTTPPIDPVITTTAPLSVPSDAPSSVPSTLLSDFPSGLETQLPLPDEESDVPSNFPSAKPSDVPSSAPSDVPIQFPSSAPSDVPIQFPSSAPSNVPSAPPSNVPSARPSFLRFETQVPSAIPSSLLSDTPSVVASGNDFGSTVPSSVPSATFSDVPTELITLLPTSVLTLAPTQLKADDVALLEATCTQFLTDYLPLVQPNDYSDLDCSLADPSARRRLTVQEVLVPFPINGKELMLAVTGDVPDDTDFAQVVTKTFDTFGEELQNSLSAASPAFREEGNEATPIVPDDEEAINQGSPSSAGAPVDWLVLGCAIAGGVCLALVVSLFIVKKKISSHQRSLQHSLSHDPSKSISVSSVRESQPSYRETPVIKLVSIEASRSLQQKDEEDELAIPPTPFGVDIPNNLFNSPAEIESEISPSSFFGECPCNGNMKQMHTFEGLAVDQSETFDATIGEPYTAMDGHTTFNTGITSFGDQTANDDDDGLGEKQSRELMSTDSSELEGLRLVGSNPNTNVNVVPTRDDSKTGGEQQFIPPSNGRRGFFSFVRPISLRKRPPPSTLDSGDVQDCCANDSWTVRTNSLLTPRKANTTNSARAMSTSF